MLLGCIVSSRLGWALNSVRLKQWEITLGWPTWLARPERLAGPGLLAQWEATMTAPAADGGAGRAPGRVVQSILGYCVGGGGLTRGKQWRRMAEIGE